ncbi:MAG: hypothetical protein JNM27_12495 [Leptospirales bacterium]|nr:hypothetical protein [Leptospirales bacterium]
MLYLKQHISANFSGLSDLAKTMVGLFAFAIKHEFENVDGIKWISVGYEQGFSIGLGTEKGESRRSLRSILSDQTSYYELLETIDTSIDDAPFFTAMLASILMQLETRVKADLPARIAPGFHMFVWTDDECYNDAEIKVPDYSDMYDEDEEQQAELFSWISFFAGGARLGEFVLNMVQNKYKGEELNQIAREYWA